MPNASITIISITTLSSLMYASLIQEVSHLAKFFCPTTPHPPLPPPALYLGFPEPPGDGLVPVPECHDQSLGSEITNPI